MDYCQQKLTQVLCTRCGRLRLWVERTQRICSRLRTLTPERFYWLKDNFPSLMSEIEALGLMPYLQDMAFGPIPNRADVSEAVASGEIKPTGKSVSVDEVIADIDEHLKGESNL